MDRRPSIVVVAVGLGAAVAVVVIGRGGPPSARVESVVNDLDGRLREASASAEARAVTLAQLPRLAWAVATDENTMLDLSADELAFQAQPGEFIEIAQVQRRTGAVLSLRRVGPTPLALPLGDSGLHLIAHGGQLHVASIVSVEPKERADRLRGAVGVSRRVELTALEARLQDLGVGLRLQTSTGTLTLGPARPSARGTVMALHADAARGATLWVLAPSAAVPGATWMVAALVLLGSALAAAALFWHRGRAAPLAGDSAEAPLPDLVTEVHVDLRGQRRL